MGGWVELYPNLFWIFGKKFNFAMPLKSNLDKKTIISLLSVLKLLPRFNCVVHHGSGLFCHSVTYLEYTQLVREGLQERERDTTAYWVIRIVDICELSTKIQ